MKPCTKQNKTAIFLLILGILFLILGVYQGGYRDAFQKAIRVCLECIGIG
ncbi:MAG: hypothetical protein LIP16_17115 [Clostridium sp.]|nr:hypothetical protein [Clostridium sp.]